MIRNHEKPLALRAGLMALFVHGVLLLLLFFSIHWKSVQPMQIATVELWDHLPSQPMVSPAPFPEPEKKVEVNPEPKIEPDPPTKIDIQVKKIQLSQSQNQKLRRTRL